MSSASSIAQYVNQTSVLEPIFMQFCFLAFIFQLIFDMHPVFYYFKRILQKYLPGNEFFTYLVVLCLCSFFVMCTLTSTAALCDRKGKNGRADWSTQVGFFIPEHHGVNL
jgi:hypothetical protein